MDRMASFHVVGYWMLYGSNVLLDAHKYLEMFKCSLKCGKEACNYTIVTALLYLRMKHAIRIVLAIHNAYRVLRGDVR